MNCMPSLKSSLRVVHERRPIKSGLKPPPPLPPSTSQSMTSSSHEVPEQIGSLGERCRSNPTIARSPPTELVSLSFLFSNNNFYSRIFRNFPWRPSTRKLRCYDLNAQRQRVLSYRIGQIQQRSEKELDFLSIKNIYSLEKTCHFLSWFVAMFSFVVCKVSRTLVVVRAYFFSLPVSIFKKSNTHSPPRMSDANKVNQFCLRYRFQRFKACHRFRSERAAVLHLGSAFWNSRATRFYRGATRISRSRSRLQDTLFEEQGADKR